MSYRWIQFDAATGKVCGSLETVALDSKGEPVPIRGKVIVDSVAQPAAATAVSFIDGVFTQPTPVSKRLSKFEFMSLLTPEERVTLRTRAQSDPVMADALEMLGIASHVDCVPPNPLVTQMLTYVVGAGMMTPQRRDAFVAAMTAKAY